MTAPPTPLHEAARLAALHGLGLLDTPREPRFDRYVRLARALADVPISAVSFVDTDRQWFKSSEGLRVESTGRDISFCGHAILESGVFYVPDACADPRFADNPLVTGAPYIRFYAGCPLYVPGGHAIGTLCIIDRVPRRLDPDQLKRLRDLADCLQREVILSVLMQDIRMRNDPVLLGAPAFMALNGAG